MINTTAIARALKANLAAQSIRIKHVQALDLIAAGIGLANRHVLATLPNLKPIQRVNIQLLTSAATALALHDVARRRTIIVETSELLQKHATSKDRKTVVLGKSVSVSVVLGGRRMITKKKKKEID